jgi:hypothetical protein
LTNSTEEFKVEAGMLTENVSARQTEHCCPGFQATPLAGSAANRVVDLPRGLTAGSYSQEDFAFKRHLPVLQNDDATLL